MRDRAEIIRLVRVKDEYGAETVREDSKGCFWCNVASELDGREIGGDRIQYTNIVVFKFRTLIPLADNDLLRWKGKDYRILSVSDKWVGDYKEVRATETDSYGGDKDIH